MLTHWGWVTHICISKLTIIVSDNALSPGRHQAIIWTNAGILLIWTLGTSFSEVSFAIYTFSFKKMQLKMLSGKWRPFCLGLNVLKAEAPGWRRGIIRPDWWLIIMDCSLGRVDLDLLHKSHNGPATSAISHNAPFCNRKVDVCAHFCYKLVHCGISV